jgi:transposase
MLTLGSTGTKIYLLTSHTDMRKGAASLALLVESLQEAEVCSGSLFVFRGKSADKIKILWYDGQGFCLFYKALDAGKFTWLKSNDVISLGITKAQLSMLIEGVDWRNPTWSKPPERLG